MICTRCSHRLAVSSRFFSRLRTITTTPSRHNPENPPPATSTSAAQPFSTPFTPSPSKTPTISSSLNTTPSSTQSSAPARSGTPAGTPLRGLGYTKGQDGPVAKEDREYPEWLWGLLDKGPRRRDETEGVGDAFAKSKKQRRLASKAARALASGATPHIIKVPLDEQSIDLPSGMGLEEGKVAREAREELQGAMRASRRRKIKENNFLRGMR
ncbi:hypothetical protein MMC28_009518 [Mycoblastus sanguinarius]|nr:hypothetical protein [Mycoblastus sanguinarius]